MQWFGGETKDKTRPSKVELAQYILKCLRAYGYGDDASVTLRWKIGVYTLSITLDNRDIKSLS